MRVAATVELTDEQRQQLEKQARARSVSVRLAQRSKMILLAAAGWSDRKIGAELRVKRQTVARWRSRFIRQGFWRRILEAGGSPQTRPAAFEICD